MHGERKEEEGEEMTKEHIERGALIEKMFPIGMPNDGSYPINAKAVRVTIEKAPAADVVEVRHGEWVIDSRFHRMIGEIEVREMLVKCPYCHRQYSAGFANGGRVDKQVIELARERYPYCHCGAKMDGGK